MIGVAQGMNARRTHEVAIDRHSVLVDGRRIQIVSGALHYFRVVHEEWRERLEWCRAAGINTIETVVPWNFHEYREGEYQFDGDKDIGAFLDLCHELGFYAIVRPSPYICAEWDNGGLPLWLQNKTDVALRCASPVLLAHVRRWSDVLLPQLAERQVTRGGPILMVQIENEYGYFEHAQEREYLEFLRTDLVEHGIEVPLFTCDLPGRGMRLSGVPTCANFGSNAAHYLSILRAHQPDYFLFVSELWLAWFDHWGGDHHTRTGRSVANILKEVLAAGGQYNFYMWSGGTNFGYYGGRTTSGDYGAFITTSYDYDAPIGETGYITDKFGECRLVNYFARTYADLCLESEQVEATDWAVESGATLEREVHVTERRSLAGGLLFVQNKGTELRQVVLEHAGNPTCQVGVALLAGEMRLFPCDWALASGWRLVVGTVEPVARLDNAYFFYGEAGALYEFICEKNGAQTRLEGQVPESDAPLCHQLDDAWLCVYNRETAKRCDWEADQTGQQRAWLPSAPARAPSLPGLSFTAAQVPVPTLDTHSAVARPLPLEAFGALQGYGWYCASFDSDGQPTTLVLRGVRDRARVYLNGRYQGAVGAFAAFALCAVVPRQGSNELAILADNLGRYCFTAGLGEHKGIAGVWLAGQTSEVGAFVACDGRECVELPFASGQGVLLRITGMREHGMRFGIGDHVVYHHRRVDDDDSFVELDVTRYLRADAHVLWLERSNGDSDPPKLSCVTYDAASELTGTWRMSAGAVAQEGSQPVIDPSPIRALPFRAVMPGAESGDERGMDGGPVVFRAEFALAPDPERRPLKLSVAGLGKGVAWLNGRNLGRYWSLGPQTALYIPESALDASGNELFILDEEGRDPGRVSLLYAESFL
jgi:hypothetical protein